MFYKLQDVMFIEFITVIDIYELARLTQLKKDHYKRIDDAKFRRRSDAITNASNASITTTTIIKTTSIIVVSSSALVKSASFVESASKS